MECGHYTNHIYMTRARARANSHKHIKPSSHPCWRDLSCHLSLAVAKGRQRKTGATFSVDFARPSLEHRVTHIKTLANPWNRFFSPNQAHSSWHHLLVILSARIECIMKFCWQKKTQFEQFKCKILCYEHHLKCCRLFFDIPLVSFERILWGLTTRCCTNINV